MTYTCPVCGYNELEDPPNRFEICPSCGTEFGNDDYFNTHAELRQQWITSGAKWWSDCDSPPPDWSPVTQLLNIPYEVTDADLASIDTTIASFSFRDIKQAPTINDIGIAVIKATLNIIPNRNMIVRGRFGSESETLKTLDLEIA